jgi:hypothetical protein
MAALAITSSSVRLCDASNKADPRFTFRTIMVRQSRSKVYVPRDYGETAGRALLHI